MADIEMPQLGETVTEGTITKWFKAVGDEVAEDEVLFEVSTDKVDSEVPSPAAGYLAEILVGEGDTVDVGTKLAVISADQPSADGGGETVGTDGVGAVDAATAADPEAQESAAAEATAEATAEAPAEAAEPAPAPEPATAADGDGAADASAQEPSAAESSGRAGPEAETRQDGRPARQRGSSGAAADASGGAQQSVLLSPVVRRLIDEHHLDAAEIQGTGSGGRITRSDVEQLIQSGAAAPAVATRQAPDDVTRQPQPAGATAGGATDTVEPLNNIRRRTAEHMVRSKAASPHVFSLVEVDYEAVDRVRRAHKEQFKADEGFSLTYLPFVARALVDAIAEFPHMNATVGDGELIVHHEVNLGIAVDLNHQGLIVPVVHGAQDMRLRAIARRVSDLADRARSKKLSADDITGGTITISNNGGAGTLSTTAIINQPQVAVLSLEGVTRRPVVVTDASGTEALAIHSVGNLTLGWDHRAFDGAYAGAFLDRLRRLLQERDWEAEL